MKRLIGAALFAGLFIFSAAAISQDKKPAPPKLASIAEKEILVKRNLFIASAA